MGVACRSTESGSHRRSSSGMLASRLILPVPPPLRAVADCTVSNFSWSEICGRGGFDGGKRNPCRICSTHERRSSVPPGARDAFGYGCEFGVLFRDGRIRGADSFDQRVRPIRSVFSVSASNSASTFSDAIYQSSCMLPLLGSASRVLEPRAGRRDFPHGPPSACSGSHPYPSRASRTPPEEQTPNTPGVITISRTDQS